MRINGYRCDACCKEHLLESKSLTQSFSEGFPGDWFMLAHGQHSHEREPLLFCSVKCLWDWSEKQITGLREVVPRVEKDTRRGEW